MDNFLYKTNYSPQVSQSNFKDVVQTVKRKDIKSPNISYFTGNRGSFKEVGDFQEHAYDLYEYGRIIDTESFVSVAFKKKRTLVLKQGFNINSKNEENLKYVKQRISEIEYVSKTPFRKFLKELAFNLIAYHNAYIAVVRNFDASSGKVTSYYGRKDLDPIAAVFNLAPETITVKPDSDTGEIVTYRQSINSQKYRDYSPENIIHVHYDKRTGFLMGTPPLEPVKDDILALRRIEESVETLIFKNLFPIIHVKVGTEKHPARTLPNGISEVSEATKMLRDIEDDGGLVTSERVEVSSIGSESLALRVESYLKHFKQRVYSGLGMSNMDFGDGDTTGRATGEVLSASLADSVVDYQTEIEDAITRFLFDQFLVESGRYNGAYEITEEDRVFLELKHRSQADMITQESHTLNKMQSGLITHDEARHDIGKKPIDETQYKNTSNYRLTKAQVELNPKPTTTGTATKTVKSASNTSQSKVKPKNQHTKDSFESLLNESISTDRLLTSGYRMLCDYGMQKLTHGIMGINDAIDNDLSCMIRTELFTLVNNLKDLDENPIRINVLASKIVDKIDKYVDNIHNSQD